MNSKEERVFMAKGRKKPVKLFQLKAGVLSAFITLFMAPALVGDPVKAAPNGIDLNRALQIGWYSMRVQNPFGTNYTGLVSIKSYNRQTKDFIFVNKDGQEVVINESDISFIYFRQLPDRGDVNVKVQDVRNIQITPFREFLYDVPPGRLAIDNGSLLLDTRWRIAQQTPFDVNTNAPVAGGGNLEQMEIPRRIQLNYLGNHYLVESELVNIVTRTAPDPSGGTVPRRLPTLFPIPSPAASPSPTMNP
ncbi:MAG: hypothetical protein VKL58_03810 [Cyanobacteriota bacterium]|nr:hypothetical protein [Cyanobacteriota bacterium]